MINKKNRIIFASVLALLAIGVIGCATSGAGGGNSLSLEIVAGQGPLKKLKFSPGSASEGEIRLTYPPAFADNFVPVRFNSRKELLLDLPCYGGDIFVFEVTLKDGSKREFRLNYGMTFADRYAGERGLDKGVTPLMIADLKDYVDKDTPWGGPEDLSFKGNVKWDDSNLYLYLVVTDDVYYSAFTDRDTLFIWQADAVQFILNMDKKAGVSRAYEIGFARHATSGRILSHMWFPDSMSFRPAGWEQLFLIDRNEDAKITTYDLTIPWSSFSRNVARDLKNNNIGFAVLLVDKDGPDTEWLPYQYGNFKGGDRSVAQNLYLMGEGEYETLLSTTAEAAVKKAEQSKNITDCDMARNFAALIRDAAAQTAFTARLDGLGL